MGSDLSTNSGQWREQYVADFAPASSKRMTLKARPSGEHEHASNRDPERQSEGGMSMISQYESYKANKASIDNAREVSEADLASILSKVSNSDQAAQQARLQAEAAAAVSASLQAVSHGGKSVYGGSESGLTTRKGSRDASESGGSPRFSPRSGGGSPVYSARSSTRSAGGSPDSRRRNRRGSAASLGPGASGDSDLVSDLGSDGMGSGPEGVYARKSPGQQGRRRGGDSSDQLSGPEGAPGGSPRLPRSGGGGGANAGGAGRMRSPRPVVGLSGMSGFAAAPASAAAGAGAAAAGGGTMPRDVSKAELKAHCSEGDMWVAVNGAVYDISSFVASHPGGASALVGRAGTDVTRDFVTHSSFANAEKVLTTSTLIKKIGALKA